MEITEIYFVTGTLKTVLLGSDKPPSSFCQCKLSGLKWLRAIIHSCWYFNIKQFRFKEFDQKFCLNLIHQFFIFVFLCKLFNTLKCSFSITVYNRMKFTTDNLLVYKMLYMSYITHNWLSEEIVF